MTFTLVPPLLVIGRKAFAQAYLTGFAIPETVEVLEEGCFENCGFSQVVPLFHSLTRLKRIERKAFHGASFESKEYSIVIPKTVEFLGADSFSNLGHNDPLEKISFEDGHFSGFELSARTFSATLCQSFEIPRSVEVISEGCFYSSNLLETIRIPKNVTFIGEKCFLCAHKLMEVLFEEDSKLREIGRQAFSMTRLKKVHFPKSLAIIGDKCFYGCHELSDVVFHEDSQGTLERIGFEAFSNCKLVSIYFAIPISFLGKYLI
jgi:hypothetical protein